MAHVFKIPQGSSRASSVKSFKKGYKNYYKMNFLNNLINGDIAYWKVMYNSRRVGNYCPRVE